MLNQTQNNLYICPACRSANLTFMAQSIKCKGCGQVYQKNKTQYRFIKHRHSHVSDPLDKIKLIFKKHERLYKFLVDLVSPVYLYHLNYHLSKFLKSRLTKHDLTVINLGSGNTNISNKVLNVDFIPYDRVHIVADINRLPFRTRSVDVVINIAVLEHVAQPDQVVSEIYRVLKKGGLVYTYVPFMQGFHASPHDYTRFTHQGLKVLFQKFKLQELSASAGPTSALLWIFQDWLAVLLSFGKEPFHSLFYIVIMIVTFPIKFLDLLFMNNPLAKNIASGFIVIGQK